MDVRREDQRQQIKWQANSGAESFYYRTDENQLRGTADISIEPRTAGFCSSERVREE